MILLIPILVYGSVSVTQTNITSTPIQGSFSITNYNTNISFKIPTNTNIGTCPKTHTDTDANKGYRCW